MDTISKKARSRLMSRIKGKGNKTTEARLAGLLRAVGLKGWRRQHTIMGKPDFAWPKEKVALFTDGCFWHGCPECYRRPKTNKKFWDAKISRNRARDSEVDKGLSKAGWTVVRVWEHELKRHPYDVVARIARVLDCVSR